MADHHLRLPLALEQCQKRKRYGHQNSIVLGHNIAHHGSCIRCKSNNFHPLGIVSGGCGDERDGVWNQSVLYSTDFHLQQEQQQRQQQQFLRILGCSGCPRAGGTRVRAVLLLYSFVLTGNPLLLCCQR